jgi:hypothetical protein
MQVNFGLHDLNNNGNEVPVQAYAANLKSIFATIKARVVSTRSQKTTIA